MVKPKFFKNSLNLMIEILSKKKPPLLSLVLATELPRWDYTYIEDIVFVPLMAFYEDPTVKTKFKFFDGKKLVFCENKTLTANWSFINLFRYPVLYMSQTTKLLSYYDIGHNIALTKDESFTVNFMNQPIFDITPEYETKPEEQIIEIEKEIYQFDIPIQKERAFDFDQ